MSSPVTPFPNLVMPAQTAVPETVSVPAAPPEMLELPAGTILPGVLKPAGIPAAPPVLAVTLPDGREIEFPVKTPHASSAAVPVSIKIMPQEIKDLITIKIHHSAPLPDIKKAAKALETAAPKETAVITPQARPTAAEAVVLRSVPEQIARLMPDLISPEQPVLPGGTKLSVEIMPEQNALPVFGRPQAPAAETAAVENNALPPPPADETVKIIELPKDKPASSAGPEIKPVPGTPPSPAVSQPAGAAPRPVYPIPASPVPGGGTILPDMPQPPEIPAKPVREALNTYADTGEPPGAKTDVTVQTKTTVLTEQLKNEMLQTVRDIFKPSGQTDKTAPVPADGQNTPPPSDSQTPQKTEQPFAAGSTIKGIVFAPEKEAPVLIATKAGVLALADKVRLPHLTPVLIRLPETPAFSRPLLLEQEPLPAFKNTWTVLTHALETLRQTDETAFNTVKNILPQTGNKLPALMLSFMNAAAQGTPFAAWFGETNAAALKNMGEKGETLLRRLEKEFSASAKKATDGRNSWKGWDIPLLSGSVVEPVSLFLQRPPEETDKPVSRKMTTGNGVRFVLDLNLSKLGKMQMEGLAHRRERIFELTIRHKNDLPSFFDSKVHFLFTETLSALNYAGTLQVKKTDDFISFMPEETPDGKSFGRGVLV